MPFIDFRRLTCLSTPLLGLAILGAAASASAKPAAPIIPPGPPQPSLTAPQLPGSSKAGWSCGRDQCAYAKVGGSWSQCFIAWAPSHRSWRPTRYCH